MSNLPLKDTAFVEVESKRSYTLKHLQFNVMESHIKAKDVQYIYSHPAISYLVCGKKMLHFQDTSQFPFFPGESIVLPKNKELSIDFPSASKRTPTICWTITIAEEIIHQAVFEFNELLMQGGKTPELKFEHLFYHIADDFAINKIINRLYCILKEDNPAKDLFADYAIKELVIRLLQSKTKGLMYEGDSNWQRHEFSEVVQYIKNNLTKKITIDQLAKMANMSQAQFFRKFKSTFGKTPISFINSERILLSKKYIKEGTIPLSKISVLAGFHHPTYFFRQFKKIENITPGDYKKHILDSLPED